MWLSLVRRIKQNLNWELYYSIFKCPISTRGVLASMEHLDPNMMVQAPAPAASLPFVQYSCESICATRRCQCCRENLWHTVVTTNEHWTDSEGQQNGFNSDFESKHSSKGHCIRYLLRGTLTIDLVLCATYSFQIKGARKIVFKWKPHHKHGFYIYLDNEHRSLDLKPTGM